MKFVNVKLKLGNMRQEQEFTVYPLTVGETVLRIQSDQRFAEIDLLSGKGVINKKGMQYANSWKTRINPLAIQLNPEQLELVRRKADEMRRDTNVDGSFTVLGK